MEEEHRRSDRNIENSEIYQLDIATFDEDEDQKFERVAATYTCLRSPFLLPVWSAEKNGKKWQIVQPALTPLLDILRRPHTDCRFLHRVFYPIAMALDTLHTVVPERRSYFFHRDVCLKYVVMPECKSQSGENVYGNARLKLSDLSKQVFSEETSTNSVGLLKYYHLDEKVYTKEHDWYSFGVFMVEVIYEIYERLHGKISEKFTFQENGSYRKYSEILKTLQDCCSLQKSLGDIDSKMIMAYLKVAELCIDTVSSNKELQIVSKWKSYVFEYQINEVAARLFGKYKGWESYNSWKHHVVQKNICQSCLTAKTANIPARTFRCENADGCSTSVPCEYYCKGCYRNREKKFCPVHGTASTVLGHMSSYALIFFGEEFEDDLLKDSFKKDAEKIRSLLMHQRVHGLRKENIILKGLDGDNPMDSFKTAVNEMANKIHKFDTEGNCTNVHQYELFVYYSGHGLSKENPGTWCPTESNHIESDEIHKNLMEIRKCTGCQSRKCCVQIIWLMDHCFPDTGANIQFLKRKNKEMPRTLAVHLFSDDKASYDEYGKGYITEMYCDILLSKGLVKKQCDDVTDSGVKVDLVTADNVPLVLSSYEGQGQDITVSSDSSKKSLVLAYCNIDAVKYTILSLYGAEEPFECDFFAEDITLEQVEQKIKDKFNTSDTVLLLTNLTTDCTKHTLVWDHQLQDILERGHSDGSYFFPAAVYYQTIQPDDQLTIELQIKDSDHRTQILLPVSVKKLCLLSGVDTKSTNLLPNILVYIVHQLYRSQPKDDAVPNWRLANSDERIAAPSDNKKPDSQLVYESLIKKIDNTFETLPSRSAYDRWLHLSHKAARTCITVIKKKNSQGHKDIHNFVFHVSSSSLKQSIDNRLSRLEWIDDRFSVKPDQVTEGPFDSIKTDSDRMTTSDEGFSDMTNSMTADNG